MANNIHILFLGNHPTSRLLDETGGIIDSMYRSNEAIIKGLREHDDVTVSVITSPDVPRYPKCRLYLRQHYSEKDDCTMVSMLNVPVFKHIWTAFSMFFEARKKIKKNKRNYVIIPYMVFRHVLALRLIARFCKNVKVGLVVPDIFFYTNKMSKLLNSWSEEHARKSDFFIFYTEPMSSYLGVENKCHITIEGFKSIEPFQKTVTKDFIVLYSGTLNIEYGIGRLIEAMKLIKEEIYLHVYGAGNGENIILEAAAADSRIKYFGKVNKEKADAALFTASTVINPRSKFDGEYVNYSFPSKDIDYLASGRPAILCKLPGMPVEYYPFFIDGKSGTPQELADAIVRVYYMSSLERDELSLKAFSFISDRMNTYNQATRIIKMLKEL